MDNQKNAIEDLKLRISWQKKELASQAKQVAEYLRMYLKNLDDAAEKGGERGIASDLSFIASKINQELDYAQTKELSIYTNIQTIKYLELPKE